ncbi:MAG: hypothetical protein H6718_22680 [Polyangiaceae bacterium]|nr:hypothetical protein [Polyangiaceae bacterium]MCB9610574.1 hypothetical protein [Polyangiaceae bacterium]
MLRRALLLLPLLVACSSNDAPSNASGGAAGSTSGGSAGSSTTGGATSGGAGGTASPGGSAGSSLGGSAGNPIGGVANAPGCPAPITEPSCNATTGLTAPLADCSTDQPCNTLSTALAPPDCRTTASSRPAFDDNPPRAFPDGIGGATRYACVFAPSDAASVPRPLLLFFHGSHGDANNVYNSTLLRQKAETATLGGSGAAAGFVLASVQGRNTHWVGVNTPGSHHDYYYRDLSSPSCNPDVRNADNIVDGLVAEGIVDPQRIYVSGWSNGGFFAAMYAIARHATSTPGGNKIAAAVSYAGADPFLNIDDSATPSCRLNPYPKSSLPIQLVHRACDGIVPCDAAHHAAGTDQGFDVESWATALGTQVGAGVEDLIIASDGSSEVATCDPGCTSAQGTLPHLRWPDGVADGSNQDYEVRMLEFLAAHPLAP